MSRILYIIALLCVFPSSLLAEKWDGNYFTKFSMDVNHPKCPFPIPFEFKLTIKNGSYTGNIVNRNISNTHPCCSGLNAGRIIGKVGSNGNISTKLPQDSCGTNSQLMGAIDKNLTLMNTFRGRMLAQKQIKLKKTGASNPVNKKVVKQESIDDPISIAFKSLPSTTRKDIQEVLKEKGFYSSTIDGLFGKGTRKSILSFFKDQGLDDNIEKIDLEKELLLIASLKVIKGKEKQQQLRKEKEVADKKEKVRSQTEKLAREQKEAEEKEKEQARLESEKREQEQREAEKLAREQKEKEERKAKEKAYSEKVNSYKEESSDLINDIKRYISNNDDFDVIQLGKRFIEVEKLLKNGWGNKTVEAYENLRTFVFSSDDFKTYYDQQVKERLKTYQRNLATVKEDLNNQLPVIKKFIADNLGSEKVEQAIELGEVIKKQVVSDSLESLANLKGTVNRWLKENDLLKSEIKETTTKENSEEKTLAEVEAPKKVAVKMDVRSLNLVKEVGDGFDNFEAIENTFLLPLIIDIYTKNNDQKKQLTFELAFEGMVPIYPDVDASEAFGAQEGIRFFDGNISLVSNTKISMVFIIPIQAISKEEGTVSLFVDKTLSSETTIKISK